MTIQVQDLKEFHDFVAGEIFPLVKPGTLFLLSGELGAGKTELIKTVAEHFKMSDVQSPTFSFHNVYHNSSSLVLHHVDLYRLNSEEDLESTGFWDLFENENDVMFVEWSNLIHDDAWPWGWKRVDIDIKKLDGNSREINLKTTGID